MFRQKTLQTMVAARGYWVGVAVLTFFWGLEGLWHYEKNPFPPVLNDEVSYVSSAQDIAQNFDFHSRLMYFESLLTNSYPMKEPHYPGFAVTLALFNKIFSPNEYQMKIFNYMMFWLCLVGLYHILFALGEAWPFATLVGLWFVAYPIVNLNSLMAEVTVIFSNLILFYIMFIVLPKRPSWTSSGLGTVALFYGYLVRLNSLFIVPGLVFFLKNKRIAFFTQIMGAAIMCLLLVANVINANRMASPDGFMFKLGTLSSFSEKLQAILQNFSQNIILVFTFNEGWAHNASKLLFYAIALLGTFSYPFLSPSVRLFFKGVFVYFLINSLMCYLFYDNFDWRYLRTSIQFVPLFLYFTAIFLREIFGKWGSISSNCMLLLCIALTFLLALKFHENMRLNIEALWLESQKVASGFAKVFHPGAGQSHVITDVEYPRFVLDYPDSDMAVFRHPNFITEEVLGAALKNYPANYIVLATAGGQSLAPLFQKFGFRSKELGTEKLLVLTK
jgi:hypothetical protein